MPVNWRPLDTTPPDNWSEITNSDYSLHAYLTRRLTEIDWLSYLPQLQILNYNEFSALLAKQPKAVREAQVNATPFKGRIAALPQWFDRDDIDFQSNRVLVWLDGTARSIAEALYDVPRYDLRHVSKLYVLGPECWCRYHGFTVELIAFATWQIDVSDRPDMKFLFEPPERTRAISLEENPGENAPVVNS